MADLPFEIKPCLRDCGKECGANLSDCPTYRRLPPVLQERCQTNLHLLQYLHMLPLDEIGMPEYYETLNRGMRGTRNPNLIYPANEHTFVHILSNPEDIRNHYIPVEPCFAGGLDRLLEDVELRLADVVQDDNVSDEKLRVKLVLDAIDKLVAVGKNGGQPAIEGDDKTNRGSPWASRPKRNRIRVTPAQYDGLRYLFQRNLEGVGLLEPMIQDNYIEDISCSGLGNVFVEHRIFGGLRASIAFDSHEQLDKFVVELAESIKHPVTFRDPCVDATLPDGSRINIVYGTDVSKRGSNFTVRKFSPVPMSVIDLLQLGTLDHQMAAYLSLVIQEQMNVWVSGETASGKTTLLNAIATFIPPESKVVSIEDTPEIQVPHPNWIRGVARGSTKSSTAAEVSMFDLLKAALRQRPNMLIVGEIRGEEGAIAFQAMQTGHACMSTFHAASVPKLIQRLTGNPICVPKSYVDNLNVVVITQMVRLPDGSSGRRITSISEIVSYDSVADTFSFIDVFVWRPLDDVFDFKGYLNSYLLEEKIAARRGIPHEKSQQIYSQIKQRAEVLRRIQGQKISDFHQVYKLLSKAYREGYFR